MSALADLLSFRQAAVSELGGETVSRSRGWPILWMVITVSLETKKIVRALRPIHKFQVSDS